MSHVTPFQARFACLLGAALLVAVGCSDADYGGTAETANTPTSGGQHNTVAVTDDNFSSVVLESDKPVLVDFWASWCGPCLQIAPVVEELALDYADRAVIGKLDVDAAGATAAKFNVESIPTLIVFKDGKEVDRIVGAVSKATLKAALDKAL